MSPSDFGHQKWGPRGGPGGVPGGGPGGAKKGSPGGGPLFCNFCEFLQPIRRPHFFKISRRPPPGPCPPRGGTPRGGGVRGVPDPQKSTFLENPSWVGTKNGHFSTRPGGGGGYLLFLSLPGAQKSGFLAPRAQTLRSAFLGFLYLLDLLFFFESCLFSLN